MLVDSVSHGAYFPVTRYATNHVLGFCLPRTDDLFLVASSPLLASYLHWSLTVSSMRSFLDHLALHGDIYLHRKSPPSHAGGGDRPMTPTYLFETLVLWKIIKMIDRQKLNWGEVLIKETSSVEQGTVIGSRMI